MTGQNIYIIRDKALKTKKRVFSIRELSNLINKPYSQSKIYLNRLIEKKLTKKIKDGLISFTDNNLIESTQILSPSYISLTYALYLHKIIQQIPFKIEIVSTKRAKFKSNYTFYNISPKLFFGYTKESTENSYYFLAEPEKALLDLIYFYGIDKELFLEFSKKMNKSKIKKYIEKYKTISGYRSKRVLMARDYFVK